MESLFLCFLALVLNIQNPEWETINELDFNKELNITFSLKSVMKGVTLIRALNLWSPFHFWVAQYFPVNDKYCRYRTNQCYWKFITKYFFLLDFFLLTELLLIYIILMWLRGIDMKWTNILNNILSSEKELVVYQKKFLSGKIWQFFFLLDQVIANYS